MRASCPRAVSLAPAVSTAVQCVVTNAGCRAISSDEAWVCMVPSRARPGVQNSNSFGPGAARAQGPQVGFSCLHRDLDT